MRELIPLPIESLTDQSAVDDAIHLLMWTGDLIISLMNDAAPHWHLNGGKDLDLEELARLRVVNARIHNALSKLRAINNGAPCQSAPSSLAVTSEKA